MKQRKDFRDGEHSIFGVRTCDYQLLTDADKKKGLTDPLQFCQKSNSYDFRGMLVLVLHLTLHQGKIHVDLMTRDLSLWRIRT